MGSMWFRPNSWNPGESISAVRRSASTQYQVVLVVVCLPELSAREISPVSARASGVGKSTLVNRLVPEARAQTGEISRALNSGKHTTTSTTWYWVDAQRRTALIDSPGFQEFGLNHIEPMQLAHLMPDLNATLGQCRFYNCTHLHEPGCGVVEHVQTGEPDQPGDDPLAISENRYRLYRELFAELSDKRRY